MAISVTCPHCRATFRIKQKYAGRQGACPECKRELTVPTVDGRREKVASTMAAPPVAPPIQRAPVRPIAGTSKSTTGIADRYRWYCEARCDDPSELSRRITEALDGKSFRPRVPIRYRLYSALLIVWALAMPVVYLVLIACVLLLATLLIHEVFRFKPEPRSATAGRRHFHLMLLAIGSIVTVVVMLRPLFLRLRTAEQPAGIKREHAPLLFLLIDRLCSCLGAVPPKSIYLDLSCNAGAGIGTSWRAVWNSEYTLSLGLPLVAGLTIEELAGVIAHELGHFNQSLACRLGFVVHRLQLWFARVVFEPSGFDRWVERRSERVKDLLNVVRVPLYGARKSLKLLMRGTNLASNALSRQQEFDADQSMCYLVGSESFESILARILALEAAAGSLDLTMNRCLTNEIIFDDYPKLVVALADRLESEVRQRLTHTLSSRTATWTGTHPADGERIERVRHQSQAGILSLTDPASVLFRDFGAICRAQTAIASLGGGRKTTSRPTVAIVHEIDRWRELDEIRERFYRCVGLMFQAKGLSKNPLPSASTNERVKQLQKVRGELLKTEPGYRRLILRLEKVAIEVGQLRVYASLFRHMSPRAMKDGAGKLPYRSLAEVEIALESATMQYNEATVAINRMAELDGLRLRLALALLDDPAVRSCVPEGDELARKAQSFLELATGLDRQMPDIMAMWQRRGWLNTHLIEIDLQTKRLIAIGESPAKLANAYRELIALTEQDARRLCRELEQIRVGLGEAPYPFMHGRPGMTIGQFAAEDIPHDGSPANVTDAAWSVAMTAGYTHDRICQELASIAEQVEDVLGLKRMPRRERLPEEPKKSRPWWLHSDLQVNLARAGLIIGAGLLIAGLIMLAIDFNTGVALLVLAGIAIVGSVLVLA